MRMRVSHEPYRDGRSAVVTDGKAIVNCFESGNCEFGYDYSYALIEPNGSLSCRDGMLLDFDTLDEREREERRALLPDAFTAACRVMCGDLEGRLGNERVRTGHALLAHEADSLAYLEGADDAASLLLGDCLGLEVGETEARETFLAIAAMSPDALGVYRDKPLLQLGQEDGLGPHEPVRHRAPASSAGAKCKPPDAYAAAKAAASRAIGGRADKDHKSVL